MKVDAQFLMSRIQCAGAPHDPSEACSYRVAWSINPHMRPSLAGSGVDSMRAAGQHAALASALRNQNATVDVLNFVHGAYDSVFAKDNAVLVDDGGARRALLARPRFHERAREHHVRASSLARRGFETTRARASFEGGDVLMLPGREGALLGTGFRSSAAAAPQLASFLDAPVTILELTDPRLYHLDVAMSVLDDGTALVSEDALTRASMLALERTSGIERIVVVRLDEACAFALNVVQVGDAVLGALRGTHVARAIVARGLRPVHVGLEEFHRAGGSAACLVARVHTRARLPRLSGRLLQHRVDARGHAPPIGDRPHDERLPARGVARGEDTGHARRAVRSRTDVPARVEPEP